MHGYIHTNAWTHVHSTRTLIACTILCKGSGPTSLQDPVLYEQAKQDKQSPLWPLIQAVVKGIYAVKFPL